MAVVVIGTMDTKGAELLFLRDRLREHGLDVRIVDCSGSGGTAEAVIPGAATGTNTTTGTSEISHRTSTADVSPDAVYRSAGTMWEAIRLSGDRGAAVSAAAKGAARLIGEWHNRGEVDGVVGLGGSAGSTISAAAVRDLPIGLPKIIVSTLASGNVSSYVGVRDVCMMHSVTDFCGLNRLSRQILGNAASAMAGMVQSRAARASSHQKEVDADRPIITATMFGVTTPCVHGAKELLDLAELETLVFHAVGTGGRTMEAMIRDGFVAGVLDITTTELADELVGGILSAGPDRLTAAAIRGIPQLISVGALDMVNFGRFETVPVKFSDRRFHRHNENVTLMRTTPEENDRLGKEIAEKACAARGPTAIILPLRGVSAIDKEGGPFWWPEADQALFQSIRNWISPAVPVIEVDAHINDRVFAETAVRTLRQLMDGKRV